MVCVEVRKELMIASSRAQMQTWKQSKQSVAQEQQRVNSTPTTTNASKQQSLRCQLQLLMKETASNETGKKVKSRQAHFCDKDYKIKTTTTFQSLSYQKNLRFDPVRYRLSNAEEIEIWMEFNNICGQKEAYQTMARRVAVRKQIFGFWFVAWRCLPRGNLTVLLVSKSTLSVLYVERGSTTPRVIRNVAGPNAIRCLRMEFYNSIDSPRVPT